MQHKALCVLLLSVLPTEIVRSSKRRFQIGIQADCADFLSWLVNALHRDLIHAYIKVQGKRSKRSPTSIVSEVFSGRVRVQMTSQDATAVARQSAQQDIAKDSAAASNDQEGETFAGTYSVAFCSVLRQHLSHGCVNSG